MLSSWWHRKWRTVLLLILLPVLVVPVIGALLFPEIPLAELVLFGLISSAIVAQAFRMLRTAKIWGLRMLILIFGGVVLVVLFFVLVRHML